MNRKIEIINNWNLNRIFTELENGNMKIPRFQRGYVWERSKVVKLLNSIYKQYPIGSFFIWIAPKEYNNFYRELNGLYLPKNSDANYYSFILDGQQRITSLYVTLKGKKFNATDYSSICFNLDKKEFHIPRLKNEKNNIPAWKLFNVTEYGNILTDYAINDRSNDTSYSNTWRECQQIFSDYPISVVKTLDMDLDEVVEIFEKINQGGKRLSLFDLVHATTWSEKFDLRTKIKKFNEIITVKFFGGVNEEVFTQSLALNSLNDCTSKNQLKLTEEKCLFLWDDTVKSIQLTLDTLKSFGVKNNSFLPYSSFIPVLQYYFFTSKKKAIGSSHLPYIEKWFWTSTFSQRYSSSSLTRMTEDSKWIKELSLDKLEENVIPVSLSIKELTKIKMQSASVIKYGVLCLMALEEPKDFDNGQSVTLDNTIISRSNVKENHHFFPYSKRNSFSKLFDINALINFVLITKRLNQEISASLPSEYFKKYANSNPNIQKHLSTHFITEKAIESLSKNDFEGFIKERAKNILEVIKNKTNQALTSISEEDVIEDNIENEDLTEENNNHE